MGFKKEVKYGSVTIDFIVECAKVLGLNPNKNENLRIILHRIGFEVSVFDEEKQAFVPSLIERTHNINVRCVDKPYLYRKTTVFSGRLRTDFPNIRIYDNVDILDVSESSKMAEFVNALPFEQPTVEKVNTRKYTKKEDRSDELLFAVPDELESVDLNDVFNYGKVF